VTKKQARVTKTKHTIFVVIQKQRGCLLFDALAWPQHIQKVQKQFWMASHDEDAHQHPRFGARCANLA
jgi:hypothetical protein